MDYDTKVIIKKDDKSEVDKKKKNKCVDMLHKTKNPKVIDDVFDLLVGYGIADKKQIQRAGFCR